MTLLVAPDAFKGTFAAAEVAEAIAAGVEAAGAQADRCPAADGGEGTMAVLLAARGGEQIEADAHDPLRRAIRVSFALLDDGTTAIVETAAASGHGLVADAQRDAEAATTTGTGELIVAALAHGAQTVLVGAGGSATTDGGAGAIAAIEAAGGLGAAQLVVLCDVGTPFEDAAVVFGPQKGADPAAVVRLRARLDAQAAALPRDPRGQPMTGAAGGLAGGLWAAFGARLVPGAAFVLDAIAFDARLAASSAVITGEGRVDEQTFAGKAVAEVAARARAAGKPLHLVAGSIRCSEEHLAALGATTATEAPDAAAMYAAGRTLATAPGSR